MLASNADTLLVPKTPYAALLSYLQVTLFCPDGLRISAHLTACMHVHLMVG